MKIPMPELLSPAGSVEVMKACYSAGADAVYMGLPRFSARAFAENAGGESYAEAIDYAHVHGKRLYLTVNTLFKEKELFGELYDLLKPLYEAGLDAVIMQDIGGMAFVHQAFPGLPIHASTQCTVTSPGDLPFYRQFDVKRVVPARELNLREVRALTDSGVEVECFIHGALCYSYSGQCLFSSLAGGRSGNRGRCAQPCRMAYNVDNEKGKTLRRDAYVLSLKDLNTLEELPDLLDAGIASLKIEGRMKKAEYAAGVTSIYRKYLDLLSEKGRGGFRVDPADQRRLFSLFNRQGFTDGYYKKHNAANMLTLKAPDFREEDTDFTGFIRENYIRKEHKTPVIVTYEARRGKPFRLSLSCELFGEIFTYNFIGDNVLQEAENRATTAEDVEKQLRKLGNTDFSTDSPGGVLDEGLFIPVSALNEWRRQAVSGLREEILKHFRRPAGISAAILPASGPKLSANTDSTGDKNESLFLSALVRTKAQLQAASACKDLKRIYLYASGLEPAAWKETVTKVRRAGKEIFLALPQVMRDKVSAWLTQNEENLREADFDGFLAGTFSEFEWVRGHFPGKSVISDHNLYAFNSPAGSELKKYGFSGLTVPVELNRHEALEAGFSGAEMIVYGRYPMMVSANCIHNTLEGCDRRPGVMYLTDRMKNRLPVLNDCTFCMNTILNGNPLSLLDCRSEVQALGVTSARLQFTVESGEETSDILELFGAVWARKERRPGNIENFTRGHFKRGVD